MSNTFPARPAGTVYVVSQNDAVMAVCTTPDDAEAVRVTYHAPDEGRYGHVRPVPLTASTAEGLARYFVVDGRQRPVGDAPVKQYAHAVDKAARLNASTLPDFVARRPYTVRTLVCLAP